MVMATCKLLAKAYVKKGGWCQKGKGWKKGKRAVRKWQMRSQLRCQ